jgi:hypothetical protein
VIAAIVMLAGPVALGAIGAFIASLTHNDHSLWAQRLESSRWYKGVTQHDGMTWNELALSLE